LASSNEEGKPHGQYLRERERELALGEIESGKEMQCNYSTGGGCYKKKIKSRLYIYIYIK
jgi:hypothetical protein